ncbi:MAG: T9SS C-terminal target domain-containing protein [Chlorobi bacterium]|nr:T9SS C-terminal target domain-containing protein [Chlorobiota bacterium]
MIRRILRILVIILLISFNVFSQFENKSNSLRNSKLDSVIIASPDPVAQFNRRIKENSGLIYYHNLFWTFNDSGGKNVIFGYSISEHRIVQKIIVSDAQNRDWEDITQDSSSIYIGDFGNNFGTRSDLVIYKIPKSNISEKNNGMVWADKISFRYEDQYKFESKLRGTAYDCEAFFYLNNRLYVFTKDWVNRITKMYELPVMPGNYVAKLVGVFNIDGLVTAADISPDKKTVALLGYKDYMPFMVVFTNFKEDDFFNGKKIRYNFNEIFNAQTEGLTFTNNHTIYISAEKSKIPAMLYKIELNTWKNILY